MRHTVRSYVTNCVAFVITSAFLSIMYILGLRKYFYAIKDDNEPYDNFENNSQNPYPRKEFLPRISNATLMENKDSNFKESNIIYDRKITTTPQFSIKDNLNNTNDDMKGHELIFDIEYYFRNHMNIEIEKFEVETQDGFIIDLWHLKNEKEPSGKHPILYIHGLMQSGASIASSCEDSIAYFLYNNGLDVWLGNNRCGFYPKWSKNIKDHKAKWNWDINEMVKYDLRALIDTVLEKTEKERLTLICHSQGTTQCFMGLVNGEKIFKDNYQIMDKVDNLIALAPAVYPGDIINNRLFMNFMSLGINYNWVFGTREFLPIMMLAKMYFTSIRFFSFTSYFMFNYLFDWNDRLWDPKLRDVHFIFSPVYVSVKLMRWWLGNSPTSFKNNSQNIFPFKRQWFNRNVNEDGKTNHLPNILLFVPRQDKLVDGESLIHHFINYENDVNYKVWYIDEYSHMDVLWATDVIERVGKPILQSMIIPNDTIEA